MSYADLESFKSYLRMPENDETDDVSLQADLDAATREIDHVCSRTFEIAGAPATARFFTPRWSEAHLRWTLTIDDLMTTTDLAVMQWSDGDEDWTTPVTVTSSDLRPMQTAPPAKPWNLIVLPDTVDISYVNWNGWQAEDSSDYFKITARWGWTAVPDAVQRACLLQAGRLYKRRDALFGIAGAPDGSDATRLNDRIDPDAVVALRGYIRYWAAR